MELAIEATKPFSPPAAIAAAIRTGLIGAGPHANPNRWDLHELTEVAAQQPIAAITANTTEAVRLARGFRNLIHPGRAERLGTVCDQGTSLVALGALESVARDLQARYP